MGIQPGSRVLEIGCGQAQTTRALADAAGPAGHVVAIDAAAVDYGTPINIGDSASHLLEQQVSGHITFLFETTVTADLLTRFGPFDSAILSHSPNFFDSRALFSRTVEALLNFSQTLCIADWHTVPMRPSQLPHLLLLHLQAQQYTDRPDPSLNCRLALSELEVCHTAERSGWNVEQRHRFSSSPISSLFTSDLDIALGRADALFASEPSSEATALQGALAAAVNANQVVEPLDTFLVIAGRS